jgi:cation diffusion facilitator CzcD-associated flavoprotein CzcO
VPKTFDEIYRTLLEDVARRYGVDGRLRYRREISRCASEDGRWRIRTTDGATDAADVVIAATGESSERTNMV